MLLLFSTIAASAQKPMIHGKLTNEEGVPLPFASVMLKGTKAGVQTDENGIFDIATHQIPATLVCSMVGYASTEKKLTATDFKDSIAKLTISLKTQTTHLEEVVTIGYGSDYSEVYGSSTASAAISGKASGLHITSPVTSPSIRIRGAAAVPKKTDTEKPYGKAKATTSTAVNVKNELTKTRLLTAGEVNDFKKWTMWEDYNDNDFKTHSERWGLFATQRYSVQLQNNAFKTIVGEQLYLLNRNTGDTLWAAVSDNTGKAELWKGFSLATNENDLVISVEGHTQQIAAVPFAQGINRISLNRSCTVSNKVEIAFVVDATGSMQDEIDYLKEELGDILTQIAAKDTTLDIHTGSVFYRDKGDEYITRIQPITPGISGTIQFIKNQKAGGGGDYPEAMKEALQAAVEQMSWSKNARTKIIFLLMDAPPHEAEKMELAILIQKAAASGIRIVPVACSGTDKATEFIMRSMALATNGTYLFLTDDSGIGNKHIKPTTDEFKVELLNGLLQRVIEQMCYVNTCGTGATGTAPLTTYSNTDKLKLFPNPTTGPVTVETNKELKELYVADFTGKILMRINVKDKKERYQVDLSAFPSATYFIRYTTKENSSGAEKIILVR